MNITLKEQNESFLNSKLTNVFHFLELSGSHTFLIGSSKYRNIIYSNDYDLNENLKITDTKQILSKLYHEFLSIFDKAYNNSEYYILDFKCGYEDKTDEPIRWSYNDMKRGYKVLKRKYTFEECLIMTNNTIKLDMCVIIDGLFTDLNILYTVHIKTTNNKNIQIEKNETKDKYIETFNLDIEKYLKERNYFKVLKRYWSLSIINKHLDKNVLNLFNSDYGRLYKLINTLEFIILMLEQKFKPISMDIIINNLESAKQFGSYITMFNIDPELNEINLILKYTKNKMIKSLDILTEKLTNLLNEKVKNIIMKLI